MKWHLIQSLAFYKIQSDDQNWGEIFYLSIDHNQSKVQSDLFLMTTVSF